MNMNNVHLTGGKIENFDQTVAQYVKSNSTTIKYIDRSKFIFEDVDYCGYMRMCDIRSIKINDTTTIGDICDMHHSKRTRMVQMKNGEIHRIVPCTWLAMQLIDDGYSYRIDQYAHTIAGAGEDAVNVCVKFAGDMPPERKKTPLLLKIGKDSALYSIGYHVQAMGPGIHYDEVKNIVYSIDGECVHSSKCLNDYYRTVDEPTDPDFIQVISLELPKYQNHFNSMDHSAFFANIRKRIIENLSKNKNDLNKKL